jgi:hypothetical protein
MDNGYILFWIVFTVLFGISYYRFITVKSPLRTKVMESLSKIWIARKKWLVHGGFIAGALLLSILQYSFSSPEIQPYIFGETTFQLMPTMANLGIPTAAATFANYLLLLIGAFLLVSALRKTDAIPQEKEPVPPAADFRGFSAGRLILFRIFGFVSIFYLLWQLYNQSQEPYLVALWLITIVVFGYLILRLDGQNNIFLGPGIRRSTCCGLAGYFCWAW